MICRNCQHSTVGTTQQDELMNKLGYRTCKLAKTPVEQATFFRGSQPCKWIERTKK